MLPAFDHIRDDVPQLQLHKVLQIGGYGCADVQLLPLLRLPLLLSGCS
jgi:hypothetical protein